MKKEIEGDVKIEKVLKEGESCFCVTAKKQDGGLNVESTIIIQSKAGHMAILRALKAGTVALIKAIGGADVEEEFNKAYEKNDFNKNDVNAVFNEMNPLELLALLKTLVDLKGKFDSCNCKKEANDGKENKTFYNF